MAAQWLADLGYFVDARVRAIVGPQAQTAASASFQFATVTQTSPLRIQLESGAVPAYAPPCAYPALTGDRVVVASWGTDLAILGPIAAGTDTGWKLGTFYTPNGFDQWTGADKARWRRVGTRVEVAGTIRQTASGSHLSVGMLVGLPAPVTTQQIGQGQWQSGAKAFLVISGGGTEMYADTSATSGTFDAGFVRISGHYYTDI